MKKLATIPAAAIALCVATSAMPAFAATHTDTNDLVWTYAVLDGTNVKLGDNNITINSLAINNRANLSFDTSAIPWTFTDNDTDYTVVQLDVNAFNNFQKMTGTLTIPDTVKTLGQNAFYGCIGIDSIASLGGVTNLGIAAFYGCTGVESCPDLSGVEVMYREAFRNCTGMSGTAVLSSLAYGCYGAFQGCSKLEAVFIPGPASGSSTTQIESKNFLNGATSLEVFIAGPKTALSSSNSQPSSMFTSVSGCRMFLPADSNFSTLASQSYAANNTFLFYGEGQDLDLAFDYDAKTITATPTTAHALTNVLAAAATFKDSFGYNTKICMTNAIEVAEGTVTDEMASGVEFESLVFNVKTQAQLDMVLAATDGVSTPLCLDPSGAKEKMVLPADRKAWVLLSGEGEYRPHIDGFIITFH